MMLNRSNDAELDFDFEKVKEKTKENPVYYVQYAYARINSIIRTLKKKLSDKILIDNRSFNPNEYEKKILRKKKKITSFIKFYLLLSHYRS